MRRPAAMVGGSMLRSLGRAVGAGAGGLRGPFSAARSARPASVLHVSPSGATSPTFVSSGTGSIWSSRSSLLDGEEWERVGEEDTAWEEEATVDRCVFGRVPSREEAEDAVSTLHQMLAPLVFPQVADYGSHIMDDESEATGKKINAVASIYGDFSSESLEEYHSDWIEPALQLYASESSKYRERQQVFDALQMFRTNESLQKVVASISSDKAVWDAVINNEAVQELRKSMFEGTSDCSVTGESDEHTGTGTGLRWFFLNAKTKITEFILKVSQLAQEIFPCGKNEMSEKEASYDGAVRSSLMISIMVLMVIILNRLQRS